MGAYASKQTTTLYPIVNYNPMTLEMRVRRFGPKRAKPDNWLNLQLKGKSKIKQTNSLLYQRPVVGLCPVDSVHSVHMFYNIERIYYIEIVNLSHFIKFKSYNTIQCIVYIQSFLNLIRRIKGHYLYLGVQYVLILLILLILLLN